MSVLSIGPKCTNLFLTLHPFVLDGRRLRPVVSAPGPCPPPALSTGVTPTSARGRAPGTLPADVASPAVVCQGGQASPVSAAGHRDARMAGFH